MIEKTGDATTENGKIIVVEGITVGYVDTTVLENVSFSVRYGEILTVLGPSGSGKSTLLKAITGLLPLRKGQISIAGVEINAGESGPALSRIRHQVGVLFQSGALLGSLTVEENVALPLEEFTRLPKDLIREMVQLKLDLVKLGKFADRMPAELSGGMKKRAGLARSMALDPKILFCDEPSSGLDPATAAEIDGLLLELAATLGVTVVVVTHELGSIENLASRCIMLDSETKGIIASGPAEALRRESKNPKVRAFFQRSVAHRADTENPE